MKKATQRTQSPVKTYMEEQTGVSFDWYKELRVLRRLISKVRNGHTRGAAPYQSTPEFKDQVIKRFGDAEDKAFGWITCACGNLCKDIPRSKKDTSSCPKHAPVDRVLRKYGGAFHDSINDGLIALRNGVDRDGCMIIVWRASAVERADDLLKEAKACLDNIEKRSEKVLRDMRESG